MGEGEDRGDKELRKRLSQIGEARRAARGISETNTSRAIKRRITAIAHKNGMFVEWTLQPLRVAEGGADVACGCGCGCGCGCSCIA